MPRRLGSIKQITSYGATKWQAQVGRKYLGGQYTSEEEAEEAIQRYKADPENFDFATRRTGTISKRGDNSFYLSYKHKRLGTYSTHEEAEEGLKRYLEDPENYENPELRPRFHKRYQREYARERRQNEEQKRYQREYGRERRQNEEQKRYQREDRKSVV